MRTFHGGTFLVLTALAWHGAAHAELDSFLVGTGRDGALIVDAPDTVINRSTSLEAPAAAGATRLSVSSTEGFAAGGLVMLLQTTGVSPEPPSGATGTLDLSSGSVGAFELARLDAVDATTLSLTAPLFSAWPALATQVLRVPEYTGVTVKPGASLTAPPWDGSTGGVLAFLATGTVNNYGTITVTGRGFRGGAAVADGSGATGCTGLDEPGPAGAQKGEGVAVTRFGPAVTGRGNVGNGGGGGVCQGAGGGGGGNGGAGGHGGPSTPADGERPVGGLGGMALDADLATRVLLGGGGGAGHGTGSGGRGGGILFMRGFVLYGSGSLRADGQDADGAGGGGGAGGSILARFSGTLFEVQPTARGGAGTGSGGGGGGGRILVQSGLVSGACAISLAEVAGGPALGASAGTTGVRWNLQGALQAPAAPVLVSPTAGTLVSPWTTVSGSSQSAGIIILVDNKVVGADGSPKMSWTMDVHLQPGSRTLVARSVVGGLLSPPSAAVTITVNDVPLLKPEFRTPSRTGSNRTPLISGTTKPGAWLQFSINQALMLSQPAGADGWWSFQPSAPLTSASYSFTARATDGPTEEITTQQYSLHDLPTGTPVITAPVGGLVSGQVQVSGTVALEGIGTIVLLLDGHRLGSSAVTGTTWNFQPPFPLPEGTHQLSALAMDESGWTSGPSNVVTLETDFTRPPKPQLVSPAPGSWVNHPVQVLTGTAEPGATVVVQDGSLCTVTADANGTWVCTLPYALNDYSWNLAASAMDAARNRGDAAQFLFTVDTRAPTAPWFTSPSACSPSAMPTFRGSTQETGGTLTVSVDGEFLDTLALPNSAWSTDSRAALPDGPHTATAQYADRAGNVSALATLPFTVDTTPPPAPVVALPGPGDTTPAAPALSGTAEPGNVIRVAVDGTPAGSTTADGLGAWSIRLDPVADGAHALQVTAVDACGNATPGEAVVVNVDAMPPGAPVANVPAATASTFPVFTGTTEPGSTVTVFLDGVLAGTASANDTGAWSFTAPWTLAEGPHTFSARATDGFGNTGADLELAVFMVDTTAPGMPVLLTPADGSLTRQSTPVLSGVAEPHSTVWVLLDGTSLDPAPADALGAWSVAVTVPLQDGSHSVDAEAQDGAGNLGDHLLASFQVDTTATGTQWTGTPPAITPARTAVFTFRAESAVLLECRLDGGPWETCSSPWVITNLVDGTHTLEVRATDTAGNVEDPPARCTWTVVTPVVSSSSSSVESSSSTEAVSSSSAEPSSSSAEVVSSSSSAEPSSSSAEVVSSSSSVESSSSSAEVVSSSSSVESSSSTAEVVSSSSSAGTSSSASQSSSAPRVSSSSSAARSSSQEPPASSTTGDAGDSDSGGCSCDTSRPTGTSALLALGLVWTLRRRKRAALLLLVCAWTGTARAELDSFGLGTGRDGALTVTVANTIINSTAQVSAPLAPGDMTLSLASSPAWTAGTLVLVVQTTGVVPEPPSGATSTLDLGADPVGRFELARLSAVTGSTLTLTAPLVHSYAATVTQVVNVPEYTTVSINAGASLVAPAWTGSTGGVLAFLATGTVTNNGGLSVAGQGQRGGAFVRDASSLMGCTGLDQAAAAGAQKGEGVAVTRFGSTVTGRGNVANGAGGGVCKRSGGGGGGNGGAGGQGGNTDSADGMRSVGGVGGAALAAGFLDHLFPGGGGGAGHFRGVAALPTATRGGGILFLRANALVNNGPLSANGQDASATTADGAAGGGAGGTLLLRMASSASCSIQPSAAGGAGGSVGNTRMGPGGGGGGGRIFLQAASGTCAATAASVAGGSAGVQTDGTAPGGLPFGAQPGSSGVSQHSVTAFAVPAVPSVTAPGDAAVLASAQPVLTGSATAGDTVVVFLDGAESGRVPSTGTWSFTPPALAEGSHTLSVRALLLESWSAAAAPVRFTVDTTPPAAPVVLRPLDNAVTNLAPVRGTAEPGAFITVFINGSAAATATANAAGEWSCTVPTHSPDGVAYTLQATSRDAVGNAGPPSPVITFWQDTTRPLPPTLQQPLPGARTTPQPLFSGQAEPFSTVTVYVEGTAVGTAPVNAYGEWSFPLPTPLAAGTYRPSITATDPAGNPSVVAGQGRIFWVSFTPSSPTTISYPSNGAVLTTPRPRFSGWGFVNPNDQPLTPGATISLYVDNQRVGTVMTDATGYWSWTPDQPLDQGVHSVRAWTVDCFGLDAGWSSTITITVDSIPPDVPVLLAPADGTLTADPALQFRGTAPPGVLLLLCINHADTCERAGTVPASGEWTFTWQAWWDNLWVIDFRTQDAAGNSSASSNSVTITVDTHGPATPYINGSLVTRLARPEFGVACRDTGTLSVYVDDILVETRPCRANILETYVVPAPLADGVHTLRGLSTDLAGNSSGLGDPFTFTVDTLPPDAPVLVSPPPGLTSRGGAQLSGTAPDATQVFGTLDGATLADISVDATGAWTLTPAQTLADGEHTLVLAARDAVRNDGAAATFAFTLDNTPPPAPRLITPAQDPVLRALPTAAGTAESLSTLTLSVDGLPAGTTATSSRGTWSFPLTEALPDGPHTLSATATDAVGNASPPGNSLTFTLDTTPPATPVILHPVDGAASRNRLPHLEGTADVGSLVSILVDAMRVGPVQAASSGSWSLTLSAPLADGVHSLQASAADTLGNRSAASPVTRFTVDGTAPLPPQVLSPAPGTNNPFPLITGSAEPSGTVTVLLDANTVGITPADDTGAWSLLPATAVPDGLHGVSATVTDALGNTSLESDVRSFTVDTVAPHTELTGTTQAATASFTFQAPDAVSFECRLDQGSWETCTSPWILNNLGDGLHAFEVRASDSMGNVEEPPARFTWQVVPPVASSSSSAAQSSSSSSGEVSSSSSAQTSSSTVAVSSSSAQTSSSSSGEVSSSSSGAQTSSSSLEVSSSSSGVQTSSSTVTVSSSTSTQPSTSSSATTGDGGSEDGGGCGCETSRQPTGLDALWLLGVLVAWRRARR